MNHFTKKIEHLNQITLESLRLPKENDILKKFTETGIKILGGSFGFAWYKQPDSDSFYLAYRSPHIPYQPAEPRKRGSSYKVMANKKPLLINNLSASKLIRGDAQPYVKSLAVIPISYKNEIYGSVYICFTHKHMFDREDKSLCVLIGNSAAQAITIQRFHNRLEKTITKRTAQLKIIHKKLQLDKVSDEAILSSIGEGLIATDKRGNVIFTNSSAEKILGWKKNELIGKSLFDSQPLLDEKGNFVPLKERPTYKALTQGKRITTGMYSYITTDKQMANLSITVTPIILHNEIIGSIQVFRDISKEKEIDRAKSELISLASHQLRTPLSAINWYTEALIKEEIGAVSKDQKKYLEQIHHANQKMVELVYDFLNVSRIELGTFSTKLSTIDVPELVQGILKEIAPLIAQKKLQVSECYDRDLTPLEADRKVIRLILQNLITNAVKYTPSKGTITIELRLQKKSASKGHLLITVSDTGYGIPKHQQSKIFTKLFRADNAAKLDSGGSGLGLYLVKSFVDFSKGKISFTSRENKGTTFYVSIPVGLNKAVEK